MSSARALSLAVFSSLLQVALGLPAVRAEDGWPAGYELAGKSESPNGRYGVLLPTHLVADAIEDEDITNKLVDLKTHHRLCIIRGAKYFPGQNHHDLGVTWATDSSWCAVTYEARYGFGNITLVEPHGTKCTQTDLGQHIQKALDEAISRQAHGEQMSSYGSAFFRLGSNHQVLVRAFSFTNPKSMEDQPDYCALFQGTFDPATGKWIRSDARKILNWDPFATAYGTQLDDGITFNAEEDRLGWYDGRLNEVYEAVHLVLPADRFAAVKKQQVAWLKQLATRDSIAAKCEFIGARIQKLRQLMW